LSPIIAFQILGFEASEHPDALEKMLKTSVKIAQKHGGTSAKSQNSQNSADSAVDTWKDSFLRAPYLRDSLVKMGCALL
jgi:hypothetical protein